MHFSILKQVERHLAQGAALALLAGLTAGCSSDVMRFQGGPFTGSVAPANYQAVSQPYPGDSLDGTVTGSVNSRYPRPAVPVGDVGMQAPAASAATGWSAPSASASGVQSAPLPAPVESRSALAPVAVEPVNQPQNLLSPPASAGTSETASRERQQGQGIGSVTKITVRPGETVYNLSRRFGVPTEAILAANDMTSARELKAGQTIVIPNSAYSKTMPASTRDSYPKVASAEPMAESAVPARKKAPVQPVSDNQAILPQPPKTRAEEIDDRSGNAASNTNDAGSNIHTVVAGDTLYGISRKTGVSVARLKEVNGLSDGYLRVGQQLKIPVAGGEPAVTVAKAEPAPDKVDVDPNPTGTTAPMADAETGGGEERKVSTYTPPKDGAAAKESDSEQVASLPDTTGIGRLRWPVNGRVISSFGGNSGSPVEDGIEIAVPDGTPIKAAENGVVIYAGDGLKEFGNTVLVRHDNGLVTVYGYASKLLVKRGDTVRRGQEIALSGMSGNADRPKVHFEVRKDSAPVDPMKYLD